MGGYRVMIPREFWVLPRPRKNKYPGGFPLHFEKKLWRLLGEPKEDRILHPFGGMAEIGERVDLNSELNPDYIGDAHNLHFIKDNSYNLIILDPPYNEEQALKLYGTVGKPVYSKYIKEAVRICKPGGFIAMYHWVWTPRPEGTDYYYFLVILTRIWHRPRVCCIFRKENDHQI
jgi:DNA modification methylase